MNAASWGLLAAAAVVAVLNWWSRFIEDKRLEYVTKPTVTVLVTLAALALDPASSQMRAWFVAAFVLCLVGDVALMVPQDLFVAGLAAFIVAQVLFVVGFLVAGGLAWLPLVAGVVVVAAGAVMVGRPIVAGAERLSHGLRLPVAAYMFVISAMVVVAFAHGSTWGVIGALAFHASDAMIGFDRFVTPLAGAPVAIMMTYHLALAGLLLALP